MGIADSCGLGRGAARFSPATSPGEACPNIMGAVASGAATPGTFLTCPRPGIVRATAKKAGRMAVIAGESLIPKVYVSHDSGAGAKWDRKNGSFSLWGGRGLEREFRAGFFVAGISGAQEVGVDAEQLAGG